MLRARAAIALVLASLCTVGITAEPSIAARAPLGARNMSAALADARAYYPGECFSAPTTPEALRSATRSVTVLFRGCGDSVSHQAWGRATFAWRPLSTTTRGFIAFPTLLPARIRVCVPSWKHAVPLRRTPEMTGVVLAWIRSSTYVGGSTFKLTAAATETRYGSGWYNVVHDGRSGWVASRWTVASSSTCTDWARYWRLQPS